MIDNKRIKRWLMIGGVLLLVVLLGAFFLIGKNPKNKGSSDTQTELRTGGIQSDQVKDFLTVYFTKKETGSNQKKYQDYLTETAFNSEVEKEKDPVQKQYTDYMKNYKYDSAKVYIGSDDQTVFVTVRYQYEVWSLTKDGPNNRKETIKETKSFKLDYVKEDGKWLVNRINEVSLDSLENQEEGDAPVLNQDVESEAAIHNHSHEGGTE